MLRHLIDISLLKRNRNYALLFAGQFISFFGTMVTYVALPYQIYELTHSSAAVGILSLIQLFPLIFTALLGGVYADRYDRKRLVIISEIGLALGSLWLAYNTYAASPSVVGIFIVSCLMSAITGLHRPAFEGMTQQLVSPQDYKSVGILSTFKYSSCMIGGPALAGLIIAHSGTMSAYLIDSLSFTLSIIFLIILPKVPKPNQAQPASIYASIKEGIQFAIGRQELLGSYLVDFMAMVFAMPTALFPAIAETYDGAKALGLLYAAPALGSLCVSFFSRWTENIKSDGKAIAISASLWGAAMVGFGLSPSLMLGLVFLILSGAFDAISGIFRSSLWNHTIPTDKRGRLAGIEMISYLSGPRLGDARAGLSASYMGITATVTSGGLFCMLAVALCCIYMPKFWGYTTSNDK